MAKRPTVLIFADPLLAPTMTFVRAQGMALKFFAPLFAGPQRIRNGLHLPEERVITIHTARGGLWKLGKLKEVPLKVFGHAPLFFRQIRHFGPVVVHAHFGPAALTALPLAQWLNVPMIVTFHGYDATVTEKHLRRANYTCKVYVRRKAELCGGVQMILAVSKFIKRRLLEQNFPEGKVVVHYIGVDTEFFAPDPRIGRESVVLFVASLNEGKGCEYVIRAMEKVQSTLPEVELVVIGDGPLRVKLERTAKERLRKYRFLGVQPPEVVRRWMNRARVFSVASLSTRSGWREAFGLVYAEAQAMGLPVVSFASGGVPEAVWDGVTGFLAPERDTEALAYHLQKLLRDEALCARMGCAGRKRVCANFDLRTQTAKLEELYLQVLGKKRARHLLMDA